MISDVRVDEVAIPLARPFKHAHAERTLAESVFVRISVDGVEGVGEAVPREYVTGETSEGAARAIVDLDWSAVGGALELGSFASAVKSIEALDLPSVLSGPQGLGLAAAAGVELALLDAVGKRFARPVRGVFEVLELPSDLAQRAERYPMSVVLDFHRPATSLRSKSGRCPHHVKVKVGQGMLRDVERVREVREVVGRDTILSVDANMAWSHEEGEEAVRLLAPFGIDWYEEPFRKGDLEGYRELREKTGAKIMLDESVCSRAEAVEAIRERAVDLFNVRISKVGGLVPALRLVAMAREHGLGCSLGLQVGEMAALWAAARHLVASVGVFRGYEGANLVGRLERPVVRDPPSIDLDGWTASKLDGAGLGITLLEDVVESSARRSFRR